MIAQLENPLLKGLNDNQRNAVIDTEGRVLVLAGAGSGKTAVLTKRMAYLMSEGVDPWRILAITFTNKASRELKERVGQLHREAYKCWAGTFHGICNRILNTNVHHLGLDQFTLIDETDQRAIVKQVCKEVGLEVDKQVIYELLGKISTWKNEGISPGEATSSNQGNQDLLAAAHIYEKYEDQKNLLSYFDFDDLLLKTVQLFRNNQEVLGKYQNQFKYILCDEVQDTNRVQFELIDMLSNRHGNIFLVGDADQSIYAFRSAKIENILNYKKLYPETKIHVLTENYRSTQTIVQASNSLVEHNKMRLDREARSMGTVGDKVHVFRFNDASREADYVAQLIDIIKKKERRDWSEFAILYRMNKQSKQIELALRDLSIPYKIVGSISFYDRSEIKTLIYYLRACHNLADDCAIEKIINVPKRSIGETTLEKIKIFAEDRKIPLFAALANMDDVLQTQTIRKNTVAAINGFVSLMKELVEDAKTAPFSASDFLTNLLKKTEFMRQFSPEKEEDEARIDNVTYLRDYAKQWDAQEKENNTLAQFLADISLDNDTDDEEEEDYVTLTSIHSAKGLEWENCFVIGMEDGIFPHHKSKATMNELEEERRLAYVAYTRAKERLFITYSQYRYEYNSNKPIRQKPSQFIEEIPSDYKITLHQTA